MGMNVKKILRFTGAVCAATSIVAMSALVATGVAAGAVAAGFKAAGNTAKDMLKEPKQGAADSENADFAEPVEVSMEEIQ